MSLRDLQDSMIRIEKLLLHFGPCQVCTWCLGSDGGRTMQEIIWEDTVENANSEEASCMVS